MVRVKALSSTHRIVGINSGSACVHDTTIGDWESCSFASPTLQSPCARILPSYLLIGLEPRALNVSARPRDYRLRQPGGSGGMCGPGPYRVLCWDAAPLFVHMREYGAAVAGATSQSHSSRLLLPFTLDNQLV